MDTSPILFNSRVPEWNWLSNFYHAPVDHDGVRYLNVEAAYQASKSTDPAVRARFVGLNGWPAKQLGQEIQITAVWTPTAKLILMENLVLQKFSRHLELKRRLLATGDRKLVERADWDGFWGDGPDRQGQNYLGRILTKTRTVLVT